MRIPFQGSTCMGPAIAFGFSEPARDPDYHRKQHEEYVRHVLGRRIRFLEPPAITEYWIQNELRMFGRSTWHPRYGMTGTIIEMPAWGVIGAGPKIRWDDGHETWLGSVSRYEYLS